MLVAYHRFAMTVERVPAAGCCKGQLSQATTAREARRQSLLRGKASQSGERREQERELKGYGHKRMNLYWAKSENLNQNGTIFFFNNTQIIRQRFINKKN